jgi:hypothetical protein
MTVSTGGAGRVAGTALLLAAAVAGLRAGAAFGHAPKPEAAGLSGAALVTVLTAGEGVALVAFVVVLATARLRRRRPEQAEEPPRPRLPWWAKILAVLAAIFAVATPLALLIGRKARHRTPNPFLLHPGGTPGRAGQPVTPPGGSAWPLIAGIVIAIAVVIAVALRARARRHAEGPRPRLAGLAESLAAGRAALAAGRTPREAIIACYAAMERGFAAAGSAPAAADTPAEVLARATEAGIVRSANAEVLTGLFRRARYGTDPVTSADSASAASALALMQAELEGADP